MGTLDTPGRDGHPDRLDELASAASEVPKGSAGQNVERSSTDDLAEAIEEYHPPGPVDLEEVDFEAYDPKHKPGQVLVIGQTDSSDNPKRFAVMGEGVKVDDVPMNKPLPDDPTGVELLEPDDTGKSSPRRVHDKVMRPDVLESLDDIGKHITDSAVKAIGENPEPTGTITGLPDRFVDYQPARPDLPSGNPLLVPVVIWAATQCVVRWLNDSKQAKGQHPDASDRPPGRDPSGVADT